MAQKLIVGITGGIGSGKSVVSRLLNMLGYPVYDSDSKAKRLNDTDEEVKRALTLAFGSDLYENGLLNRPKLASLIFQSDSNRQLVNAIIHPAVKRDFLRWAEAQNSDIVFLEAAILYESGFDAFMNKVVAVAAPEQVRIQRAMKRDNATEQQIVNRLRAQMSQDVLESKADFVVVNDGIQPLLPQIEALAVQLRNQIEQ
ncbi:MAG: dephospho-CoA kinase [Paludibacteraceae bacterium]|nr:dephospho-CoA kinase [Paludibacteraceae bacterium]